MSLARRFVRREGIEPANPLIKRSQQGNLRGRSGWPDVDGGLRTVTELIALLSMVMSRFARGATASVSAGALRTGLTRIAPGDGPWQSRTGRLVATGLSRSS